MNFWGAVSLQRETIYTQRIACPHAAFLNTGPNLILQARWFTHPCPLHSKGDRDIA